MTDFDTASADAEEAAATVISQHLGLDAIPSPLEAVAAMAGELVDDPELQPDLVRALLRLVGGARVQLYYIELQALDGAREHHMTYSEIGEHLGVGDRRLAHQRHQRLTAKLH